jgi:hypothetical protein
MHKGETQIASGGRCAANPFIYVHEGRVAEWLGGGLQNLLQWFESTRDLAYGVLLRLDISNCRLGGGIGRRVGLKHQW